MLVPVSAASAQAPITPPNRTDRAPPELRREEQRPTLTIEGDFEGTPCALDRPEFAGLKMDLARRMKDLEKEDTRLRRAVSDLMRSYRGRPRKPSKPRTPTALYRS